MDIMERDNSISDAFFAVEIDTPVKNVDMNGSSCDAKPVPTTPDSEKGMSKSPDTNSDKKRRIRRKHKGGKHHRKWKPYSKLSWDERKELEEKEGRKATLKREEQFASGQPMAPYNTTQFLMDIHDPEPNEATAADVSTENISVNNDGCGSLDSSEECYSSPDDEEIFLEKEFSHDYENYHEDYIRSLSKEQLVREYLDMEKKVEKLTKQLQRERDSSSSDKERSVSEERTTCVSENKNELLQQTRAENQKLREEIERLRQQSITTTDKTSDKENAPET